MRKQIAIVVFSTLSVFASVLYVSCNKVENIDGPTPCANVVCYNGGTCADGVCKCIPGFEGEKCQISIRDRYMGDWGISETITGSSIPSNINKTRTYTLTIKTSDVSKLALSFNNLSNNNMYKDVLVYAGRRYIDTDSVKEYVVDVSSNFCFAALNTIPNTSVIINGGHGSINNLGTYITGTYCIQYPDSGKVIRDTVSFTGDHN
jgi:hypothetical protein